MKDCRIVISSPICMFSFKRSAALLVSGCLATATVATVFAIELTPPPPPPPLPGLFQQCLQPGDQCGVGLVCVENYCVRPLVQQNQPCNFDGSCPANLFCSGDVCVPNFFCYQAPDGAGTGERSCSQIQDAHINSSWFLRDFGSFPSWQACDTWCAANPRAYVAGTTVFVHSPFNPNHRTAGDTRN